MRFNISILLFSVLFALTCVSFSYGQADASTRNGRPNNLNEEELPTGIKETLAKSRLKTEEKEFEEMLERAAEAAKLGAELDKVFDQNRELAAADFKKLEALEKLVKRIRRDLGSRDDEEMAKEFKITSLKNAFSEINLNAAKLSDELKKGSRHSLSVKAVESSNALVVLLRFVKSGGRSL